MRNTQEEEELHAIQNRLDNLEKRVLKLIDRKNNLQEALSELLFAINQDKDGDYFICREAKDVIERAKQVLMEG
jgi:3-dehydroquinate dehydratase